MKALWFAVIAGVALGGCQSLSGIPVRIGKPKPVVGQQSKTETESPKLTTHISPPAAGDESLLPSWISIGKPPPLVAATVQDHAVLQRGKPIPLWGRAQPGQDVTVKMAGRQAVTAADANGDWHVGLPALDAGGPYQIVVTAGAGRSQVINDVMIGDVYLCSGQSNIEWPVNMAMHGAADAARATNKLIRFVTIHRAAAATPRTAPGSEDRWSVADPETVKSFSAVCYFFARELQPKAGVPVGLIYAGWGGSTIQPWMSREALDRLGYHAELDLVSLHTTSPRQAEDQWHKITDAWWQAHDPAFPAWSVPAFDDSNWASVIPAGSWKDWGVPGLASFDGIIWFRKMVMLSKSQTYGPAHLTLGAIDQADKTFVNGVEVGGSEGWNISRSYTIPEGILHEGVNVIAVAVQGGDGLSGAPSERSLDFSDGSAIKLDSPWRYRVSAAARETGAIPHTPWLQELGLTLLYNGMIAPLGQTPISGVIWYQGESNTSEPARYRDLLTGLIADWRRQFGADTAFFIVQLPGYGPAGTVPQYSAWAELREVQRQVAVSVPGAALAVTIDLGDRANLHPVVKQEVGRRLALLAERKIYGLNVVASGPTPLSAVRSVNKVVVRFTDVAEGLKLYGTAGAVGFQLCDAAKNCRYTSATARHGEIDIDIAPMPDAAGVRFCWDDSPLCNVTNSLGLPAVPFELPIIPARP